MRDEVKEHIISLVTAIDGVVGVCATHLQTEEKVSINSERVFLAASTFKIFVLIELYNQIETGKSHFENRLEFTEERRVAGSGILQELMSGLQLTIWDLAVLMTVLSDNCATDMLMLHLGLENIRHTVRKMGFSLTKIPMTTKEMLYSIFGMDTTNPEHTYEMHRNKLERCEVVTDAPGLSVTKSIVSTPAEMSHVMEILARHEILTPSSCEAILDLLTRQTPKQLIRLLLPEEVRVAHKTGGLKGVRADVGVIYTPQGVYTLAVMAMDLQDETEAIRQIAGVSRMIYDYFTS